MSKADRGLSIRIYITSIRKPQGGPSQWLIFTCTDSTTTLHQAFIAGYDKPQYPYYIANSLIKYVNMYDKVAKKLSE